MIFSPVFLMGLLLLHKPDYILYTYHKSERLKSRKLIEELFTSGGTFTQFPVKVLYKVVDHQQDARLQAGVSVSSKKFKKAVDRNRIKRLLREAYRTQKPDIPDGSVDRGHTLCLFFIYIGKELPAYDDVFASVGKVLNRTIDSISSQKNKT